MLRRFVSRGEVVGVEAEIVDMLLAFVLWGFLAFAENRLYAAG